MPDWITDSQDEQSYEELIRDADQIHIPLFQRSYVWKKREFDSLTRDIEQIQDDIEKSQFLGAIVAYERPRPPGIVGRLREFDIVDGQQRLFTLYLFVMALVEITAQYDKEMANESVQAYLLLQPRRGLEVNTRIVPSYEDRNQFRSLWDRLNTPELLQDQFGRNPPRPPSPSGSANGNVIDQYERIVRYIKGKCPADDDTVSNYLQDLQELVTGKLTFVNLKLTDASVAMKIFERLNFRGVKVGIVDLVRNEIFSRCEDTPNEASAIFHNNWKPFIDGFSGQAEAFFFPYCLIHNRNVTKSELFTQLRQIWDQQSPLQIINHMTPYRTPFMAIAQGINNYQPDSVRRNVDRLFRMRSPSSIYPFVISVLHSLSREEIPDDICAKLLHFTESFLVRRSVMGFEPTGLHALYKGLWTDINPDPSVQKYIDQIEARSTIQRPTDDEIKAAVKTRPLAKSKICRYLLLEYDKSLPGDNPSADASIEHVLPDTYPHSGPWAQAFTETQHKALKDTVANLVPLSEPLNSSLQASPYQTKRQRYLDESMFKTARHVANTYSEWTYESLQHRTEVLALWVVERWPFVL